MGPGILSLALAETQQLRSAGEQPVTLEQLRAGGIDFRPVVIGELELNGYVIERSRSTTRTKPRLLKTFIISWLEASISAVKVAIRLLARPRADHLEQQRTQAPSLPVVDHGHGELRRIAAPAAAHVADHPDPFAGLLLQHNDRFVIVVVDLGQVAHHRLGQLRHRRKKAPVTGLGATVLEPRVAAAPCRSGEPGARERANRRTARPARRG
jgi:hypothetical protein